MDRCLQLSGLVRRSSVWSAQQQMRSLIISKCCSTPEWSFLNGTCRRSIPLDTGHVIELGPECPGWGWVALLWHAVFRHDPVTDHSQELLSPAASVDHVQNWPLTYLSWTTQLEETACWWKKSLLSYCLRTENKKKAQRWPFVLLISSPFPPFLYLSPREDCVIFIPSN